MNIGDRVLITYNPHHATATGALGTVVAYHPGAGFGGCNLVDVEYVDPTGGERHTLPFADHNLARADPRAFIEQAERHEAMAAELRKLAEEAR